MLKKINDLHKSIIIILLLVIVILLYGSRLKKLTIKNSQALSSKITSNSSEVISQKGVELPIKWKDYGSKMISSGVIDIKKFESIYRSQGGLTNREKEMLYGKNNGNIIITPKNAGFVLNLLWGFALGNKNSILEKGEMTDPKYGGVDRFASTGGWTISKGGVMNHYSMHKFVVLTKNQQRPVDNVSQNIYRPCCNNPTSFPDCNHGMAMLGFLELMASQGMNEKDMYKAALIINSYWFPDTYTTIKSYMKNKGIDWKNVNSKEILGFNFSSAQGYRNIASRVIQPKQQQSSCGV